jgi:transposase-like protein
MTSSIPTLSSLLTILFEEDKCIDFLKANNVFYVALNCPKCNQLMRRDENRARFRCGAAGCRLELSMRKHTFFFGSYLSCSQILFLGYLWLTRHTHQQTMTMTGHSSNTVTAFYRHFRVLVESTLSEEDQLIGGPGVIVEIDETKLGRRKYNRGHRVDGVWVLVGVKRTTARRVFVVPLINRSADTLLDIIRNYVIQGSVIHTDMWKGYALVKEELNLEHHTVNHSLHFKNPHTGVHTNTVEGTNNGLKYHIAPRNRVGDGINDHLAEFVWRRRSNNAMWTGFIAALRDVHYDLQ